MGNVLNVSFHPSEIGKHLDLLYIRFKCGARRELTQVARVRLYSLPDMLVRAKPHSSCSCFVCLTGPYKFVYLVLEQLIFGPLSTIISY